jgi:hypothetical protein
MTNTLTPSPLSSTRGTSLLRSWLVYYFDLLLSQTHGYVNWHLIVGAALMIAVSSTGFLEVAVSSVTLGCSVLPRYSWHIGV